MAKQRGTNQQQEGNRDRVVTQNRRAFFDYFVDETVEAGLVLTGSEIKSIREGKVTISEAYVRVDGDELWLIGANITPYVHGAYANHDPNRPRKLLVHKHQIAQLREAAERRGMTLVPLRLRLRRGLAKIDVGVARGKKLYDKRQVQAERDARRQIDRALSARD
jgi:SsrA-binding protein